MKRLKEKLLGILKENSDKDTDKMEEQVMGYSDDTVNGPGSSFRCDLDNRYPVRLAL